MLAFTRVATAFVLPFALVSCSTRSDGRIAVAPAVCRTVEFGATASVTAPVRWVVASSGDGDVLDRWCGAVGPAVVRDQVASTPGPDDELAIVSWNVHVGGGDVEALVADLRSGVLTTGRPVRNFVLLLQEAFRSGPSVPSELPSFAFVPAVIRPQNSARRRLDVVSVARRLGLAVYYAPSMRNGAPPLSNEDRGNAILSTLPLSRLQAVELPFERQRRVAVSASIGGTTSGGAAWTLNVMSAHLDNLAAARRVWVITGPARRRQARGLVAGLPGDMPAVLGGDFNTWFGTRDAAYRELARHFPQRPPGDVRPTFAGLLRLDHLFFRLPRGWQASWRRLDERYGSDHHPLLANLIVSEIPVRPTSGSEDPDSNGRIRAE